jgi:hypothetical protein
LGRVGAVLRILGCDGSGGIFARAGGWAAAPGVEDIDPLADEEELFGRHGCLWDGEEDDLVEAFPPPTALPPSTFAETFNCVARGGCKLVR